MSTHLTRRDFLKASSALAVAAGLHASGFFGLEKALAATSGLTVIWLQGQSCSGCSVSLLNSVYYTTVDDLLVNTLNLAYHPTVMASAGQQAIDAVKSSAASGRYVLVVEGAVPTGASGRYCTLWPGMTAAAGVKAFASNTPYVIAVGTCASYGGVPAAHPHPTKARGIQTLLGSSKKVVNIPGCPASPDWVVGTVAYMIKYGKVPTLDGHGRPTDYFGATVHSRCPYRGEDDDDDGGALGQTGCKYGVGCKGKVTRADCSVRRWNSPAAGAVGVNWCVFGRTPCHGCTEPNFPDGMTPFFRAGGGDGGDD